MKQMQKETEMKELASKIEDLTDMWQKRVRKYKKEINELRAERKKTEVSIDISCTVKFIFFLYISCKMILYVDFSN